MEIATCKNCGTLFNYIRGVRLCPNCQKKAEEKFMEVKKYVRDNPHVDIKTLSEEMEVSIPQINRWVREERLVFSDDSPIGIPCESCGVTIKTGRLCATCKTNLSNGFRDAAGLNQKPQTIAQPKRSRDNKMRFLDN